MANEKLSEMTQIPSLSLTDIFYVVDDTNAFYKTSLQQLKDFISSGIDFFDAEVDGVGGKPNVYALLSDVPAGKKYVKCTADFSEPTQVVLHNDIYLFIEPGVTVDFIDGVDVTNSNVFYIEGLNNKNSGLNFRAVTKNKLFENCNSPNKFCVCKNINIDMSLGPINTLHALNNSGDTGNFILENVSIVLGESPYNFYATTSESYFNNITLTMSASPTDVLFQAKNGSYISNFTIDCKNGIYASSNFDFSILENSRLKDVSFLTQGASSGLFNINCNASYISDVSSNFTGNYSIITQESLENITSYIVNCRDINIFTVQQNCFILGCYAEDYQLVGTPSLVKSGNNSIIGNDYQNNNINLNNFDSIVDGLGVNPDHYLTFHDAIAASKKRILIISNIVETQNTNIGGNVFVYIQKGASIVFNNVNLIRTSKLSLTIYAESNDDSFIKYSKTSGDSGQLIKNTVITDDYIYAFNLTFDNSSTTIMSSGFCSAANFQACNCVLLTSSSSDSGFDFVTSLSSFNNLKIISNSSNSHLFLSLADGAVGSDLYIKGTYSSSEQHIVVGQYSKLETVSVFPITIPLRITLHDSYISNISSSVSNSINITCIGDSAFLNSCLNLNLLSIDSSITFGKIIGCSSSSFTNNGSGLQKSGNNSIIGNDYLTSESPWLGPYTAIVGPGMTYTEVNQALTAGHTGILVIGNTNESAYCNITSPTIIKLLEATVTFGEDLSFLRGSINTDCLEISGLNSALSKILFSVSSGNVFSCYGIPSSSLSLTRLYKISSNVTAASSTCHVTNIVEQASSQVEVDYCVFTLGNCINQFYIPGNLSTFDHSYINGGGTSCTLLIDAEENGSDTVSNLTINGFFKEDVVPTIFIGNNLYSFVNETFHDIEINLLSNSIVSLSALGGSNSNISFTGSGTFNYTVSGKYSLFNITGISLLTYSVDSASNGSTIIGCNAANVAITGSGGTVIKSGNNSVIGNDYFTYQPIPVPSINTVTFSLSPVSAGWSIIYLCNTSGGNIVINIPTAIANNGKFITVKKISNDSNTVTITPFSGQTIDSAPSKILTSQNEVITITSDNSNLFII